MPGMMQSPEGAAPPQGGQQVMGDVMKGVQEQMSAIMQVADALGQAGKPGAEEIAKGVELIQMGLEKATGGGQPQGPQQVPPEQAQR